jgi:sigma-E factor negative regulatory protein RseB
MTASADRGGWRSRHTGPAGVVLLAALLTTAAAAQTPRSATEWLERASEAVGQYSFVADVIYEQGSHVEALRLWRDASAAGGGRERLMSLSGPPREILRTPRTTTYLSPAASPNPRQRYANRPLRLPGPEGIDRLDQSYTLNLEGQGRVAQRPAQRLRVIPRDDQRYGYALWLDQRTGIVLRADILEPDGWAVERFMVVELERRDALDPALLDPVLAEDGTTFDRLTREPTASDADGPVQGQWSVNDLPAGFTLQADRTQALPGHDRPARHLVFSDGIASVSVYIKQSGAGQPLRGAMSMGGVNIHARVDDGVQILVVGQVPATTVERMANATVRSSQPNTTGQQTE